MDTVGTLLTAVLGLVIGLVLGGFLVTVLQQIRAGRIKLPPSVALGPVRLDLSGLGPHEGDPPPAGELDGVRPLLEGGGSLASGCMSMLGASMILVGFLLPWFACNLPLIAGGTLSGLTALIQLVVGVVVSLLGSAGVATQRDGGGLAALGLVLTLVLLAATVFLAVTPLMGYQIGRNGFRLIQNLRISNEQRRRFARSLMVAAVAGLVPLTCTLTSPISALGAGIQVSQVGVGLWITLGGFGVAFIAGLMIATLVALAEQLPGKSEKPQS